MEYDAQTKQFYVEALEAKNVPDATPLIGSIIDTKGFESLTLALAMSNRQSTTDFVMTIEDGDDPALSDAAPVLVTDDPQTLIPADAANLVRISNGISRIGYIGKKRFIRVTITGSNVTTGSLVHVLAVLANAQSGPTTDQDSTT